MWRLSSSFIARGMVDLQGERGQRRGAKWKALLESCRRKIDTGRLYMTQFLFRFHPPFLFDPLPVLSLSFSLFRPLFLSLVVDYVSRITGWPSAPIWVFQTPIYSLSFFLSECCLESRETASRNKNVSTSLQRIVSPREFLLHSSFQFHYLYITSGLYQINATT